MTALEATARWRGLPLPRFYTFMVAVAVAVFGVGMVILRSSFGRVFGDLGENLPTLTEFFFAIPDLGWALGGLYSAAFLLLKDLWLPRRTANGINWAILALMSAVFAVCILALFLPLVEIGTGMD